MQVAPQGDLWWSVRAPDQGALWGSWMEQGELFYLAVISAPVPVDMRALRALKRSALALDLYAWLTFQAFRVHQSNRSRFETWTQLHCHMGGDYADIENFRKKVKATLRKIRAVYPGRDSADEWAALRYRRRAFRPFNPDTAAARPEISNHRSLSDQGV
jgi:hypothetical protein